ncbi:MAG: hypothetical protein ACEY3A_01385 [Wolbachia sp.]
MSENDENLTTEEETSSETMVEETSEAKTSLGAVVDNSSGKQLPEKIATVNVEKPAEKITTVNTEKPHVKFTVDEGNLPVKAIVNWGSK